MTNLTRKELRAQLEAEQATKEAKEAAELRAQEERAAKHRQELQRQFETFEAEIVKFLKTNFPDLTKAHHTIVAEKTKVAAMIVAGIRKSF